MYLGYRRLLSLLLCLVDFIVNYFAPSGILAWLRAWLYRGAQAIDIPLIFSSLDGTSSVRLKLCCTAAPRLLIFSLDGTSSVRLKLCCTAVPRLLIFSSLDGTSLTLGGTSLDGTSSVRLKLRCTAVLMLLIFSSVDGGSCVHLKLCCTQARNHSVALGAIAPSIAPPPHCTIWRFALHPM